MARNHALDDDDDGLDAAPRGATREKLKAFVERRYSTRVHMALILVASGLASMVASWSLLHAGVHAMLVRYPVAITASYLTFLLGVWVWLRVTGLGDARTGVGRAVKDGGFDLPISGGGGSGGGGGGASIPGLGRGGGAFDGGGASTSFAEQPAPMALAMSQTQAQAAPVAAKSSSSSSTSSSSSKSGFGIDLGVDGDGIVLLILAGLLIAAILCCSGYLVWIAPDVLTEAAFGAGLAGTLARPSSQHAEGGWIAGVVRKTWWPYALVMVLALAFAGWSARHYPQAATFKDAIAAALHSHSER